MGFQYWRSITALAVFVGIITQSPAQADPILYVFQAGGIPFNDTLLVDEI